jgi:GDP-L-fucose synthase
VKVLVTGASGFVGTALCKALEARGDQVVRTSTKEADLLDPRSLDRYDASRFDQLFHLAAWTQAGDFCLRHPGEQWVKNQQLNTTVLGWWARSQPQAKLIVMGTSCAYDPALEHREENYLVGAPIDSLYTYAHTKRMLLVGLQALQRQFGLRWLCLVPSTLYGEGYHTDGRQLHFIFDLIRKILRGHLHGEPVELWGDGHQRRELVYLDDFVELTLRLSGQVDHTVVNLGAGEEHSIRHFARLICEHVGYDPARIIYDESRYVGARSKCLVTDRLRGLVPDLRLTPLEVGLPRTIDWFRREALTRGAPET